MINRLFLGEPTTRCGIRCSSGKPVVISCVPQGGTHKGGAYA